MSAHAIRQFMSRIIAAIASATPPRNTLECLATVNARAAYPPGARDSTRTWFTIGATGVLVCSMAVSAMAQVAVPGGLASPPVGGGRPGGASPGLTHDGFPCGLSSGCQDTITTPDPTFIQAPSSPQTAPIRHQFTAQQGELFGEILVPYNNALVRADVPIFGRAYGKNFKEYRVEYGQGADPTVWHVIHTSTAPQTHHVIPDEFYESGDLTIKGNLATWDTGLRNYTYLPSHPPDHPTNLKGTYTVRLTVTAHDGQMIEDRVTVAVANVIPNAWGGLVKSPDEQTQLTIPEHAVTAAFRLILLQRTDDGPSVQASDRQRIGHVYEVRESNEVFTTPVRLDMHVSPEQSLYGVFDHMAIYGFNMETQEWDHLPSFQASDQRTLYTDVTRLHGFYTIMSSTRPEEGSRLPAPPSVQDSQPAPQPVTFAHALVHDTFERDAGEWSARDGQFGASVELDQTATFDGTGALKITNTNKGGSFAVNVRTSPFDAREFPIVEFDYRLEAGVKTSFFVRVAGRWYRIGVTDDPMTLRNKRVNIANIGQVQDIVDDDQWHSARFDLYELLRTKTGHTRVDAMIMADWNVPGYMRLEFGNNDKGATYYIDNFTITRHRSSSLIPHDDIVLIDNFNQKKQSNHLKYPTQTFHDAVGGWIHAAFNMEDADGFGHALALSYDVTPKHAYGGYVTTLPRLDLRGYHAISFSVKSIDAGQDMLIGMRDAHGEEVKIPLHMYLPEKINTQWTEVAIPLTTFASLDWGAIENVNFSFEQQHHSKGTVLIDNIQFHKYVRTFHVDSFEQWDGKNLLGGEHWTFANGAAAINGAYTRGSPNGLYRLSYGGNIGEIRAYASDVLTYAGWATRLGGIDCSRCTAVTFRVRGAEGRETPNIYLDDGNFRWGLDLEDYLTVTTDWQTVSIPLQHFADHGVDITHLQEFQVIFEWEQMSGTLYVDDVWFGNPFPPTR